jgi:hypothetical protein
MVTGMQPKLGARQAIKIIRERLWTTAAKINVLRLQRGQLLISKQVRGRTNA